MNTSQTHNKILAPTVTICHGLSKYGISKNVVASTLLNEFHIDAKVKHTLEIYYHLQWKSKFFLEQLREGTITRDGVTYIVVYHKCTRYDVKMAVDCRLSFRVPQTEYDLPAYVLVQPLERKNK